MKQLLFLAGVLILSSLELAPRAAAVETDRLQVTERDLPSEKKDPNGPSEIEEFAGGRGFRYGRDTRRAARGDFQALKKFFEIAQDADGAAAESVGGVSTVVYHLLGDEKFAAFLAAQPLPFRMMVPTPLGTAMLEATQFVTQAAPPHVAKTQ